MLDLPFVPHAPSSVYQQFGLTHPLVVQLVEQLPDASRCTEYQFKYHKPTQSKHWRSLVREGVWLMRVGGCLVNPSSIHTESTG